MRFGESAAKSATAKKLQAKVGAGIIESDLLPATADLPEYLAKAEFKRRFGGVDGVEYKKMMAEIERRISVLPLYRYGRKFLGSILPDRASPVRQ